MTITTPKPDLPCGCRRCGCVCERHSPTREPWPCAAHAAGAVIRAALAEGAAMTALALFVGMLAVWAAILSQAS